MIEVIGAPFDLCGRKPGSRLGPVAMRLEGLLKGLTALGHEVLDTGPVTEVDAWNPEDAEQRYTSANEVYLEIQERVGRAIGRSSVPLVIGGDHSIAIGSVSGALRQHGNDLAVLWIDAHMDINTPDTSPSGNLHGMPLAALSGLTTNVKGALGTEWTALVEDVVGTATLGPDRISWLGLRDVDAGEVATRVVVLQNDSESDISVRLIPSMPSGWTMLIPPPRQILRAGSRRHQLISFQVPHGTPAGTYQMVVALESGGAPALNVRVKVKVAYSLAGEWIEASEFVRAGDRISSILTLTNTGNADAQWN
ncbi:MAG: arginase family protein, partial [Armatimonadetes bacterium]|nr:arginase family protein [Armatimonadota bacterium]